MPILTPPPAFSLPSRLSVGMVANTQGGGRSPLTGSEQTLQLPGQRWQASLGWDGLTQDEWRPLHAFLQQLGGRAGRFYWRPPMPRRADAASDGGFGPRVLVGSQTGAAIRTTGWAIGTWAARAGDLIGWSDPAGRAQLHMVTADAAGAEPLRTNRVLWSQDFGSAGWAKANVSVSADAATAPDGSGTADKITETTANDQHFVYQYGLITESDTFYSMSVYMKAAERSFGQIVSQVRDGNYPRVYFNLATGTIGAAYGVGVPFMRAAGSGWYRCGLVVNSGAGSVDGGLYLGLARANDEYAYPGTSGSGILVWGAQLERGAPASAYIPTAGSQVTRTQDISIAIAPPIRKSPAADAALTFLDTDRGAVWRLSDDRTPMDIMRGLVAGGSLEIEEALV